MADTLGMRFNQTDASQILLNKWILNYLKKIDLDFKKEEHWSFLNSYENLIYMLLAEFKLKLIYDRNLSVNKIYSSIKIQHFLQQFIKLIYVFQSLMF